MASQSSIPIPKNMPAHLKAKLGIQEDETTASNPGLVALSKYGKQVFSLVVDNILTIVAVPVVAVIAVRVHAMYEAGQVQSMYLEHSADTVTFNMYAFVLVCALAAGMYLQALLNRKKPVYLVDFNVAKLPDDWLLSKDEVLERSKKSDLFDADQTEFQMKVLLHSGLGNKTYAPRWLSDFPDDGIARPDQSMAKARDEFEVVCVRPAEQLLKSLNIDPKDVGFVVVNCSLFSPTPSLAATIMTHLKMPSTTIGYNLAGMGCSASAIAIDLARELLQNHPNKRVLVISTENITQNLYMGRQKSMLIPNVIFRAGAAVMLLSNRPIDGWRAKYTLQTLVRTIDTTTRGYGCVMEIEDPDKIRGVKLSRDLMKVAGDTLRANMTRLAPLILPPSELILAGLSMAAMKIWGSKKVKPYVPDFTKAVEHIIIHTGGRGVIDAIQDQMGFSKELVHPSRASLFRFGNVSSASIWYVLAYIESFRGVQRGDKVWQMAFGSGFKVNSMIWKANRSIKDVHPAWENFCGDDAMYAELEQMDGELWKVLEASVAKREREVKEAAACGMTIEEYLASKKLQNDMEGKLK